MHVRLKPLALAVAAAVVAAAAVGAAGRERGVELTPLGTYATGVFDEGGSEIAAFDPGSARIFAVNAADRAVDILDASDPAAPAKVGAIDIAALGGIANSVAAHDGVVAVAIEAVPKTAPGTVAFYSTDGDLLSTVTVGAQPDMLAFTPNGDRVLVANEGEPSGYGPGHVDPEGSVSIVDVRGGVARVTQASVRTVGFGGFTRASLDPRVRVFGPGATVAQDLEPEYITVSHDSGTAYVGLQEANAIAELDIRRGTFTAVRALGWKDHSLPGNGLDPSDRDAAIAIAGWPVRGLYMPDGLASYHVGGRTYVVSANEGDARDWPGYAEEARVGALALDAAAFPDGAALKSSSQLGRLTVTRADGDTDGDGDHDALYSFGARSISIWDEAGRLVWDSGDLLEQVVAALQPADFNSDHSASGSFDNRSDNKGPEPEGIAVGNVEGRWYAFVGLERQSSIAVFDVTDPRAARLVELADNRDFAGDPEAGTAGDLGPEGLAFVSAEDSPTDEPLLVVGNEVSGTTTVWRVAAG